MPVDVSTGWRVLPLAEVADISRGTSWADENETNAGDADALPVLGIKNVKAKLDLSNLTWLRGLTASSIASSTVKVGDLLMVGSNGNPDRIGNTVRVDASGRYLYASLLFGLRPNESRIDSEYLYQTITSPIVQASISKSVQGTTGLSNLKISVLRDLPIPVPPIGEQKTIAQSLRSIDLAIDTTERVLDQSKRTQFAVLDAFLKSGNTAKHGEDIQQWTTGRIEGVHRLPLGWTIVRLVDVAKLESGHTPSRKVSEYWFNGDVGWISLHDTQNLENIEIYRTELSITKAGLENSSARLLPKGTVCFSRTATVGKCVLMGRPMATSQDFANFICSERLSNRYLLYLLRWMKPVWKQLASGSTHKTIYMPTFESLQIVVPPRAQQDAIVWALDALTETINENLEVLMVLRRMKASFANALLAARGATEVTPSETSLGRLKGVQPAFKRAVLAAEVVHQLHKDAKFGSVKHEKIVHLCEYHADLHHDIDRHAYKKAAGPYDPKARRSVEANFKSHKWFDVKKAQGGRTEYIPMEKCGGHKEYFDRYFSAQRNTIQAIIDLLRPLDSDRCQIIATLYAVWNDYLLDGVSPTDSQIVNGARNNWHASKQAIPEDRWVKALTWMRKKHLVPKGTGEKTRVATA